MPELTAQAILEQLTAKGYDCVGFVFVSENDEVVVWRRDFPVDRRNGILRSEIAGNFTSEIIRSA